MKKYILLIILALALILMPSVPAFAATTADVTVTATPAYVAIADNQTSYDFAVVAVSTTPYTSEDWCAITNTSTVQTDITIAVTAATWSGGVTWTHSDTCTPGADTAGLKANRDGTWGVSDIIIKYDTPNYIYEDCPALTDFAYGIKLWTPESYTDGVEKEITVRVSAAAG